MSAINFDEFFNQLLSGVESIAKTSVKDYEKEARKDAQEALNNMKQDLQQWTKEMETGSITGDDLKYLLQEDEDLAKMMALKQAGLAEIRIDEFRNNVINMVVGTITGLIKI